MKTSPKILELQMVQRYAQRLRIVQATIRSLAVHSLPEGATRRWDIHSCESTDALGSLSFTNLQNVLRNQRERESSSDTATRWQMGNGWAK